MSSLRSKPEGKDYWRSIERLLDSPAVRDDVALASLREAGESRHGEFPAGSSDAPSGVDRRTMLTVMGASFALAGLEGCRRPVETIVPYVSAPEYTVPGIPKYFATTLPVGAGAYGVVVESHEGRPSKIEGNALHPSSLGAANTWTQAEVLNLYDPDRSASVQRRAAGEADHRPARPGRSTMRFWRSAYQSSRPMEELGWLCSPAPTVRRPWLDWRGNSRVVFRKRSGSYTSRSVTTIVFAGCEMATGASRAGRSITWSKHARSWRSTPIFLHTESESLPSARGFAAGRKVEGPRATMNRLYVVESALSLTGSVPPITGCVCAAGRWRRSPRRWPASSA